METQAGSAGTEAPEKLRPVRLRAEGSGLRAPEADGPVIGPGKDEGVSRRGQKNPGPEGTGPG